MATAPSKDRLGVLCNTMLGCTVEVTAKSGAVHSGVFAGTVPAAAGESGMGVLLKFASPVVSTPAPGSAAPPAVRPLPSLSISASDFVSLRCASLSLSDARGEGGEVGVSTDAAIGGARRVGKPDRKLVAWQPDEGDEPPVTSQGGLGDGRAGERNGGAWGRGKGGGGGGGWDQFAANEGAFGVVSTFDENLYTTRIDKSNAGISEAEAERLAAEIERGSRGAGGARAGARAAEERGDEMGEEEGDDDEEMRFSGVKREDGAGGGGEARVSSAARDAETFGGAEEAKPEEKEKPPPPPPASPKAAGSPLNPNAKPFSFNPSARPFVPPSPPQPPPLSAAEAAAAAEAAGGAAGAAAAMAGVFYPPGAGGRGGVGAAGVYAGGGGGYPHPAQLAAMGLGGPLQMQGFPYPMPPGMQAHMMPMGYPQAWVSGVGHYPPVPGGSPGGQQ